MKYALILLVLIGCQSPLAPTADVVIDIVSAHEDFVENVTERTYTATYDVPDIEPSDRVAAYLNIDGALSPLPIISPVMEGFVKTLAYDYEPGLIRIKIITSFYVPLPALEVNDFNIHLVIIKS